MHFDSIVFTCSTMRSWYIGCNCCSVMFWWQRVTSWWHCARVTSMVRGVMAAVWRWIWRHKTVARLRLAATQATRQLTDSLRPKPMLYLRQNELSWLVLLAAPLLERWLYNTHYTYKVSDSGRQALCLYQDQQIAYLTLTERRRIAHLCDTPPGGLWIIYQNQNPCDEFMFISSLSSHSLP